jgi:A/G-specific adenine glycosylase
LPFDAADLLGIRAKLQEWYDRNRRDLPWRRTRDPYAIWVSEVMLQQTRVATAIPYYLRFLERFPTIESLAQAPESDLLAAWSGLGYYHRARNLQRAARDIVDASARLPVETPSHPGARQAIFPSMYDDIRKLPGVGDYTAAAIASIAFDLPHAVVDGNVLRVLSRLACDEGDIATGAVKARLQALADQLLDPATPGRCNQAVMELGATLCLPDDPKCLLCPVASFCKARLAGRTSELPIKRKPPTPVQITRTLLLAVENDKILFWQRSTEARHLGGFWELPEPEHIESYEEIDELGSFRHSIMNRRYLFRVLRIRLTSVISGMTWLPSDGLSALPISTTARKALRLSGRIKKSAFRSSESGL